MAVRAVDLAGDAGDEGEGSSAAAEKVVYTLHPNCAIEEVQMSLCCCMHVYEGWLIQYQDCNVGRQGGWLYNN